MVELVDTTDLNSVDRMGRAGSSPAPVLTGRALKGALLFVQENMKGRVSTLGQS